MYLIQQWPSGLIMFLICVIFNSWTTTVAGSWNVTTPVGPDRLGQSGGTGGMTEVSLTFSPSSLGLKLVCRSAVRIYRHTVFLRRGVPINVHNLWNDIT